MKTQNNLFARLAPIAVLASLLAVAGLLSVCDQAPNITVPDITISTSDTAKKIDNVNSMLSMYVGYGIDVFSGPTYINALKSRLFKNIVYKDISSNGGNSYIDIVNTSDVYATSYSSENVTDVYSKLDVHVNTKTGKAIPFFSGGFSSQFKTNSSLKSRSMFYNSIFSTIIRKYSLGAAHKLRFEEIVDSAVYAAINGDIDPENLFKIFGTHIITSNATGGALNISAVYNSDSSISGKDLEAALDISSAWADGSVNTNISSGQSAVRQNTDITVHASGGAVEVFGGKPTLDNVWGRADQWTPTISDNPTLSVIYDAVPIWELAATPARKQEIEDYFYNRAEEINMELGKYFVKEAVPAAVDGWIYVITNWGSQKAIDATARPYEVCVSKFIGICTKKEGRAEYWVTLQKTNPNSTMQQWDAVESNGKKGVFSFRSMGQTGRQLHAPSNKTGLLSMESGDRSLSNQQFRVIDNGDGSVFLRSELDSAYYVTAASGADGSRFSLGKDSTLSNAKWILNKVGEISQGLRKQSVSE